MRTSWRFLRQKSSICKLYAAPSPKTSIDRAAQKDWEKGSGFYTIFRLYDENNDMWLACVKFYHKLVIGCGCLVVNNQGLVVRKAFSLNGG